MDTTTASRSMMDAEIVFRCLGCGAEEKRRAYSYSESLSNPEMKKDPATGHECASFTGPHCTREYFFGGVVAPQGWRHSRCGPCYEEFDRIRAAAYAAKEAERKKKLQSSVKRRVTKNGLIEELKALYGEMQQAAYSHEFDERMKAIIDSARPAGAVR